MAWRQIHGRNYFYRTIREGGRFRCVYFGGSTAAERADAEDERIRQARHEARQQLADLQLKFEPLRLAVADVAAWTDSLVNAGLILSDHYQHHRQWRKRNGGRTQTTT